MGNGQTAFSLFQNIQQGLSFPSNPEAKKEDKRRNGMRTVCGIPDGPPLLTILL